MEDKLKTYRRKKRREAMVETVKNSLKGILPLPETRTETLITTEDSEDMESIQSEDDNPEPKMDQNPVITQVTYLLYFLLWATLYVIAIQIEFGAVYFIISTLVLIWINTRTKPKKKGEISAYSVFNPNCEEIDGTLNAQQFEMEIRYGPSSVR